MIGVLLVVVCAAGAVITVLRVGDREPVLSLARPVAVGHVLTAQDLQQVSVSVESGTDVVPASQAQSVLGQPVAYSLPAGNLLSRAVLGQPRVPPAGQATVAVAVRPGQFPPELMSGTTVSVIAVPGSNTGAGQNVVGGPWSAVVTSVGATTMDQASVVSLQMPADFARQIAAIPTGQLALVALPAGGQ